jgi:hypothetical protein
MDPRGAQLLNRIQPAMGPGSYKSYQIAAPVSTHWRDAACEEVGCEKYLNGFALVIDETSALGAFQGDYARHDASRSHCESRDELGMTVFTYPPGTRCFEPHKTRIERPEHFLITGGDWRGNPRGTPAIELRPDQWVDDFACHQDGLKTALDRG